MYDIHYIAPNERITAHQLQDLIQQLTPPFIIVGDFNAHNPLWGAENPNPHGMVVEDVLLATDACVLNTGEETHIHKITGTPSCIDLCLVSSILLLSWEWTRIDDLCGSDHFPIVLHQVDTPPVASVHRFQLHRADWPCFTSLTDVDFDHFRICLLMIWSVHLRLSSWMLLRTVSHCLGYCSSTPSSLVECTLSYHSS